MLREVQQTIEKHRLLPKGAHVLVGVSGGADSVALAHALHYLMKKYRLRLTIAHLHHGIRGRAADRDEELVSNLSWSLGLPCIIERRDVPALARRRRISLEMAAREARRAFFADAARLAGADIVATAHTADDQVETVLLRLLRGTGPQGLGGMAHRSVQGALTMIRPLLDVTHADAVRFLRRHGRSWCEDESNRDLDILRNRVRHKAIPFLEEQFNPQVRRALLRMADIMRAENEWANALADDLLASCTTATRRDALRIERLARLPVAARRRVLMKWLHTAGVEPEALDYDLIDRLVALARSHRGTAETAIDGSHRAVRRYKTLTIEKGAGTMRVPFRCRIAVPGETVIPELGLRVVTEWGRGIYRASRARVGALPSLATLGRTAIRNSPLFVRSWRAGDRIKPLGMKGSVKVQDLFVDQKVPRAQRSHIPLLECRGRIVWIPGYRVARGWAVPDVGAPCLRVHVERI